MKYAFILTLLLLIPQKVEKWGPNGLQLLDNLINPSTGIIVDIANQVTNLTDSRKKIVQGILALGMIALHLIAANIQQNVPSAAAAQARAAMPSASDAVEKAAKPEALERAFQAARF